MSTAVPPTLRCTRRAALGGLAAWAAPMVSAQTQAWPTSVALDYAIQGTRSGIAMRASGGLTWQRNDRAYLARLHMSAFVVFKREQISSGQLTPTGLQPRVFEDHKRRIQRADFDTNAHVARYSNGHQMDWPVNGQDRVSMLIALGPLAARAQSQGERRVSLPVSDGNDWQTWAFDIDGRETVDTPAGPWPAVRLTRSDADTRGQRTQLWLAPSLQWLPVRLLIREANGDTADQRLQAHRPLPPLPLEQARTPKGS